jgi:predicted dehydrogenase
VAIDRIRLGLIGCGAISTAHLRGYKELGNLFNVVALCDIDAGMAYSRRAELGTGQVFTDYHELLAAGIVDAVDLCLPHYLHAVVTIDCFQAGVHVLVEKPIATTLAEADHMVEVALGADKILMVGHNERYDPQYQEIKRLVDKGLLGEIFCARADHNYDVRIANGHWLKTKHQAGGGVLIGSGSHRIDLLRWLVGEVIEVFCVQVTQSERLEGEVCALVTLRFENGAVGELACNWAVRCSPWYELMWLYGTKGNIHNALEGELHLESLCAAEIGGGYRRIELPKLFSFTEELRHFYTCIREGVQPLTSGREARQTLAVILAAYQSAEQNRPVRVDTL